MELTITFVVAVITYLVAEVLKTFKLNTKFLPLVNIGVGIVAAIVCVTCNIGSMPAIEIVFFCLASSMTAGGSYDLITTTLAKTKLSKGGN